MITFGFRQIILAGICRLFGIEKKMRWGDPLGDCNTAGEEEAGPRVSGGGAGLSWRTHG